MTTNPFGQWQLGVGQVGPDGAFPAFPVSVLVQSALSGTVDDQITEHAVELFETLDERGPAALREAALALIEYLSSTASAQRAPRETAAKYEAGLDPTAPESSNTMARLLALRLLEGDAAAAAEYDRATPLLARNVTARMFVLAGLALGLDPAHGPLFIEELRIG